MHCVSNQATPEGGTSCWVPHHPMQLVSHHRVTEAELTPQQCICSTAHNTMNGGGSECESIVAAQSASQRVVKSNIKGTWMVRRSLPSRPTANSGVEEGTSRWGGSRHGVDVLILTCGVEWLPSLRQVDALSLDQALAHAARARVNLHRCRNAHTQTCRHIQTQPTV